MFKRKKNVESIDINADGVRRLLANGKVESARWDELTGCWEIRFSRDTSHASVWVDAAA